MLPIWTPLKFCLGILTFLVSHPESNRLLPKRVHQKQAKFVVIVFGTWMSQEVSKRLVNGL